MSRVKRHSKCRALVRAMQSITSVRQPSTFIASLTLSTVPDITQVHAKACKARGDILSQACSIPSWLAGRSVIIAATIVGGSADLATGNQMARAFPFVDRRSPYGTEGRTHRTKGQRPANNELGWESSQEHMYLAGCDHRHVYAQASLGGDCVSALQT